MSETSSGNPNGSRHDPVAIDVTEHNKAIVRRFIEVGWGSRDTAVFAELLDPSCHRHQSGAVSSGQTDPMGALDVFSTAFPGYQVEIELLIGERDMVVVRSRTTGVHRATYANIPASGRTVDFTAVDFYRLAAGKIVESWHNVDEAGLLRQLTQA